MTRYDIEDPRQPPEPSRIDNAVERAMDELSAEEFVALLERHERIRELAFEAVLSGRTCPTNCAGLAAMAYQAVEDAIRSDMIEGDRNERAQAKYLAEAE